MIHPIHTKIAFVVLLLLRTNLLIELMLLLFVIVERMIRCVSIQIAFVALLLLLLLLSMKLMELTPLPVASATMIVATLLLEISLEA